MNKKIKVIDLFNIIANEEEFPQTIIYQGIIYKYTKNKYGEGYLYIDEDNSYNWLTDEIWCDDKEVLNYEVEILEDNTEEIEKSNFEDMGYEIAQAYFEFYKGIAKALTEKGKEKSNE